MIVIAVIALITGGAIMSIGSLLGTKAKEASVELSGTIRLLYDSAALTGRTCRLVFTLPDVKDLEGRVKYKAECAKGALAARRDRDTELKDLDKLEKERARKSASQLKAEDNKYKSLLSATNPTLQELQSREKLRVEEEAKYASFASAEISERTFPASVRLSVWTRHQREAVKSGTAYLYFFPAGFTERSQIVVTQGSNAWTLVVSSLTGRVNVVSDALEVPKT
jgi:general secretion pathway protein H